MYMDNLTKKFVSMEKGRACLVLFQMSTSLTCGNILSTFENYLNYMSI